MHNPEREDNMFETKAMVNSVQGLADVTILEKVGDNQYHAKYKNLICTAIFNPFVGLYYVDDVYGVVKTCA